MCDGGNDDERRCADEPAGQDDDEGAAASEPGGDGSFLMLVVGHAWSRLNQSHERVARGRGRPASRRRASPVDMGSRPEHEVGLAARQGPVPSSDSAETIRDHYFTTIPISRAALFVPSLAVTRKR